MSPEYRLEFDQSDLTLVRIVSALLLVYVLLCSPSILTLFCATIKTVQIGRLSHPTEIVEEQEEDLCPETRSPNENEESIVESRFTAAGKTTNAGELGEESLPFRVATEHEELNVKFSSWTNINDDLELVSSPAASERDALGISTRLPSQENNGSDEHSEMVGLRPTARRKNPPTSVPEFSQTEFVGTSNHRASGSSSAMEEVELNKPQTGVQHRNYENRK